MAETFQAPRGQEGQALPAVPGWVTKLWPWLASALSGAMLASCYSPWKLGGLSWIALTPLICAVWFSAPGKRPRLRKALMGYVAGIVFFTMTFYWLGSLGVLFQAVWLYGLPLLLSLYLGLYLAFWAWWIGRLANGNASDFLHSGRNLMMGLIGASGWVVQEWVRGWLFSGFGWNGLGVALHRELAMIQIADVSGVLGLSFLVAFCNLMAVIIVRRILAELGPVFLKRIRWEFSLTMALVAGVFAYGVRQLMAAPNQPSTTIRIAAIQPNIAQNEKFSGQTEDAIFRTLQTLTALAASTQPQLILWPEAATPRGMYTDEANYRFVMEQAASGKFDLLIGSTESDLEHGTEFNTATLLSDGGQEIQTYRKMHLVPFGEYMPLRRSFPLFAMVAGELVPSDFTPGQEFTVMSLGTSPVRISPLICFEDTLGDLTRKFVLNGAQLLVNLTNDGWFLETAGAEQHFANSVFRAVEMRRPLVRCTNTGITASVSAVGVVDRWELKPFTSGFATRDVAVPKAGKFTIYCRYGDWLAWVCLGLVGVHWAAVSRKKE